MLTATTWVDGHLLPLRTVFCILYIFNYGSPRTGNQDELTGFTLANPPTRSGEVLP